MHIIKKMSLFAVALSIFSHVQCSESTSGQDLEFPEYTTEKYIYHKEVTTQDHGSIYTSIFGKHPNGISVTDNTYEDMLSNRVTRKRVQRITENGQTIITTQTWKSRNPSYLTWVNGALVVAAIAGIVLGATSINSAGDVFSASINAGGNVLASGVNAGLNTFTEMAKNDNNPFIQEAFFKGADETIRAHKAKMA